MNYPFAIKYLCEHHQSDIVHDAVLASTLRKGAMKMGMASVNDGDSMTGVKCFGLAFEITAIRLFVERGDVNQAVTLEALADVGRVFVKSLNDAELFSDATEVSRYIHNTLIGEISSVQQCTFDKKKTFLTLVDEFLHSTVYFMRRTGASIQASSIELLSHTITLSLRNSVMH